MFFGLFGKDRWNGRTKVSGGKKARSRRTPPLTLECLEDRLVLSGLSNPAFALHSDNSLWEQTTTGWQLLSPANTISSVSAVTDGSGQADAFAIANNQTLWEYTPTGWRLLSGGNFRQVSAAVNASGDAVVFGVLGRRLSGAEFLMGIPPRRGGWSELSPAKPCCLSARPRTPRARPSHTPSLRTTTFGEDGPSGWALLSAGQFQQISAGVNATGQSVVYGLLSEIRCGKTTRPSAATAGGCCRLPTPFRPLPRPGQARFSR